MFLMRWQKPQTCDLPGRADHERGIKKIAKAGSTVGAQRSGPGARRRLRTGVIEVLVDIIIDADRVSQMTAGGHDIPQAWTLWNIIRRIAITQTMHTDQVKNELRKSSASLRMGPWI